MSHGDQLTEKPEPRAGVREDRRAFFAAAIGAAAVGTGALSFAGPARAQTATPTPTPTPSPTSTSAPVLTEAAVLNFALNLEYLEANYYSFAVTGAALASGDISGTETAGAATGGRQVTFADPVIASYAKEFAANELAQVKFLRTSLGTAAIAQPQIDLSPAGAFSTIARSAGLIGAGAAFDPYADENNFLLGAFLFADVAVTAYSGLLGLIANKVYQEALAGILAAEAYQAATIRATLYRRGINTPALINATEALSAARDALDGATDLDQGIASQIIDGQTVSNIAPLGANGIGFTRTPGQVLNLLYLNNTAAASGGFFPAGVNGTVKTAAAAS